MTAVSDKAVILARIRSVAISTRLYPSSIAVKESSSQNQDTFRLLPTMGPEEKNLIRFLELLQEDL